MTREPTYQAARTVAATIEAHFARHLVEARRRGEQKLAPGPDARAIETIIDASFWASFHASSAISLSGRGKWCRVAISDITSLKQAEEAERRVETLV